MCFLSSTLLSSSRYATYCILSRLLPFSALAVPAALPISSLVPRTTGSKVRNVNDRGGVNMVFATVITVNTGNNLSPHAAVTAELDMVQLFRWECFYEMESSANTDRGSHVVSQRDGTAKQNRGEHA